MLFVPILCFIVLLLLSRSARLQPLPLPPSPPGDFIIGHVRKLSSTFVWKTFASWTKDFGNIFYIHLFGKPMIVSNSYQAAKDILERHGANYADRPRLVLIQELMDLRSILAFARHGQQFLSLRKMIRQPFGASRVTLFHPTHRRETVLLLRNMLNEPHKFEEHLERVASGSIMIAAYGYQIESNEDEFVRLAKKVTEDVASLGPAGGALVDIVPILRFIPSWMPGSGFKRHALNVKRHQEEATRRPFQMVQNRRATGRIVPCFVDTVLEAHEQIGNVDPVYVNHIRNAAGMMYFGAVETTVIVMRTFVLAMISYPEVTKRAHEEIDAVIGEGRLPDLEDRESLPYLSCILKETRWNPVLPLGVPRRSLEADVYRGMQIPKGSSVVANIWAMMMDKSLYDEPEQFIPERFLDRCAKHYDQTVGLFRIRP